jgi:hypothetical protein
VLGLLRTAPPDGRTYAYIQERLPGVPQSTLGRWLKQLRQAKKICSTRISGAKTATVTYFYGEKLPPGIAASPTSESVLDLLRKARPRKLTLGQIKKELLPGSVSINTIRSWLKKFEADEEVSWEEGTEPGARDIVYFAV